MSARIRFRSALRKALLIPEFSLPSSGIPARPVKLPHQALLRPSRTQNLQGLVCLRSLPRHFRLAFEMGVIVT